MTSFLIGYNFISKVDIYNKNKIDLLSQSKIIILANTSSIDPTTLMHSLETIDLCEDSNGY